MTAQMLTPIFPPISLMYHGFGHFLDCAHSDSTDLGPIANKPEFESAVNRFISKMSMYYDSEWDRTSCAGNCLDDIFGSCFATRPDYLMRRDVIVMIKNELETTNCDASIKLAAYYSQLLNANTSSELRQRFLFPALGIVVVGAHIGFNALAFTT
ncbi:hypothetical protein B0F90DRAFT_1688350 [Multifurca ochricompacta]|uniref:Uncharacterized protein n=1 Tax=Multifurca ochricompacta TaxID=376703 RepID=A0AAD4QNW4_9AGAM|nr:hypothetical protein B0F90DRAFT_1688350 [Multifurca ochricompacta]